MATGGADLLTELCQDVLSCDICSEEYDWDAHTPRILPCFHCFCQTCLEQLSKDGSLQCPTCRAEIQVCGKFPVETTRMALMDKKRELQSQRGASCEGCTEGAKATSRCQECEDFLCEDCSAAHRKLKVFKGHTVVSLEEGAKNMDKLLARNEKCQHHPSKVLELWCVTCSAAVCTMCIEALHQDGHKFVRIESLLDEKKQEMLALCDKLEKMQQSFGAKADESEASMEAVESNLNEAVHKVETVFSEIISSATERQRAIVEELRAKAKGDELLLGEDASTFRSLQAAAQTAAQHGRRCVAVSLASQVFSQTPELEKTIQKLSDKTKLEVQPAPTYKVMTDKLAELKAMMKEMGKIECRFLKGVTLPSIQLDTLRCGGECCVGEDRCSLSNQSCTHSRCQPQSQSFSFPGTCGTEALPGCSNYWQVKCRAEPKPKIKDRKLLNEFGVATLKAVQHPGRGWISKTDFCALTVGIYTDEGHVKAQAYYRNQDLSPTVLDPYSPHSPVDVTLGLLLDTARSRLHIVDVRATRVLWSSDIDLSTPVWPAVCVYREDFTGARVDVEVQSGQQIEMSGDLVRLLQSLL